MIETGGQRQLVIFAGDAVYGMDPATGRTLWKEMWETGSEVNSSTPVYRDGRLFVTSDYGKGCMMMEISPAGEKKLWENTDIESRFPQTILDGDSLYANSEGILKCMAWPTGKIRWQKRSSSDRIGLGGSLVRVAGGKLLLMTERGKLRLATADAKNLKTLAEKDLFEGEDIWSVPLVYGGRIYAKGQAEFVCLSAR
jgi:outer membrane protein assembly factor BamB